MVGGGGRFKFQKFDLNSLDDCSENLKSSLRACLFERRWLLKLVQIQISKFEIE